MTSRRPYAHRQIFKHDGRWGYSFRNSLRVRLISASANCSSYVVRTDAFGFRNDPDVEINAARVRKKVLFIGCSFTAGDGVSNEHRFTDIVRSISDKIEIYNAAMPGTGNDQQLLILDSIAPTMLPDLVVISPYSGCASRNLLKARPTADPLYGVTIGRPKPYFRLEENKLILCNHPTPPRHWRNPEAGFVDDYMGLYAPKLVPNASFGFKLKRNIGRDKGGVDYTIYDGVDEYGFTLLSRIIRETIDKVGAARAVLMPLPSNSDLFCIGEPSYVEFFRNIAKSTKAGFLDVYPHFKSLRTAEIERCFLPEDGHYSNAGHRLVAEALIAYLNENWKDKDR